MQSHGSLTRWQRIKRFIKSLWIDPKKRRRTIIGLLLITIVIGTVPYSRYFMLNLFGARASLSVQVLDRSTKQPLKNVKVTAHGVSASTDDEGRVKLEQIRLGRTELKIRRYAFASVARPLTVGWGSNPLGELELEPTGAQYSFVAIDYLSGGRVDNVEATSGLASAFSDKNGEIVLTIEDPEENLDIAIRGEGYRTENFTISADTEDERKIRLAPARYHAFIDKRSGTYDLYKIYADGQHEEVILKGTGSERDDMVILPHLTENLAVFVSARGNRNSDGFLLSNLNLVNLETNETEEIAESERIQLIGWEGDRIIYVRVAAGASGDNPKRHRLISYDYKTKDVRELAASNLFNDVLMAKDKIYYAPSGAYQDGVDVSLFKVDADGGNRKVVLGREVWNLFRGAYGAIDIAVAGGDWYSYLLGSKTATELAGEPDKLSSRIYVDSPDGKKSLWVDRRDDGDGALSVYDIKTNKDKELQNQAGLDDPISWLNNNAAVYRVRTAYETADYAVSLEGGKPKKIRDVAATDGLDHWYYY